MTKDTSFQAEHGGETHQVTDKDHAVLTTNHGMPVSDNQNQLKAGMRGPVLLEDEVYREKINHFDHERIPERIVHARGTGAHGYFECTKSLSMFTCADLLQKKGQRTDFVRFLTVAFLAGYMLPTSRRHSASGTVRCSRGSQGEDLGCSDDDRR